LSFAIWYSGRFVKAFKLESEALEWANNKWAKEKIGDYRYCVIKEV